MGSKQQLSRGARGRLPRLLRFASLLHLVCTRRKKPKGETTEKEPVEKSDMDEFQRRRALGEGLTETQSPPPFEPGRTESHYG